jgi:hypothetical protein
MARPERVEPLIKLPKHLYLPKKLSSKVKFYRNKSISWFPIALRTASSYFPASRTYLEIMYTVIYTV